MFSLSMKILKSEVTEEESGNHNPWVGKSRGKGREASLQVSKTGNRELWRLRWLFLVDYNWMSYSLEREGTPVRDFSSWFEVGESICSSDL